MSNETLTGRQALIRVAKKNENDWTRICVDLKSKIDVSGIEDPTPTELGGWEPITILDDAYSQNVRQNCTRPPFVLFAKGNMANLVPGALLIISPKRYAFESRVSAFVQRIAQAKVPAVIIWRNPDHDKADNGFALDALRAYQHSGVPFTVILPEDMEDIDALADEITASGGLALTEHYPGTHKKVDSLCSRIGSALSKAALILAGSERSVAGIDAALALNAGIDVGAIPWPPLTPAGELCNSLIKNGAACVSCIEDVLDLLGM